MTELRNPVSNVVEFFARAASDYGRIQAEAFSQHMFSAVFEDVTKSPIEDLVYAALHLQAATEAIEVDPQPFFDQDGTRCFPAGLYIYPQQRIGKYSVDFLVEYTDGPPKNYVVVELDGHDFHDKDKHQRAYEKGRDRFLTKSGYRVLHYTGSEVVADPYKVAFEILDLLGAIDGRPEYSAENPLGID